MWGTPDHMYILYLYMHASRRSFRSCSWVFWAHQDFRCIHKCQAKPKFVHRDLRFLLLLLFGIRLCLCSFHQILTTMCTIEKKFNWMVWMNGYYPIQYFNGSIWNWYRESERERELKKRNDDVNRSVYLSAFVCL